MWDYIKGIGGFGEEGVFGKYFSPSEKKDEVLLSLEEEIAKRKKERGVTDAMSDMWEKVRAPSDKDLGDLADAENAGDTVAAAEIMKRIKGNNSLEGMKAIGEALASLPETRQVQHSGRAGGSFRGANSNNLAKSLLDREYMALYNQPLYNPLTKQQY